MLQLKSTHHYMSAENCPEFMQRVIGPYMCDVIQDKDGHPYGMTVVYTVFEPEGVDGWYDYKCRIGRNKTAKKVYPWKWTRWGVCHRIPSDIDINCVPVPPRFLECYNIPSLKTLKRIHKISEGTSA